MGIAARLAGVGAAVVALAGPNASGEMVTMTLSRPASDGESTRVTPALSEVATGVATRIRDTLLTSRSGNPSRALTGFVWDTAPRAILSTHAGATQSPQCDSCTPRVGGPFNSPRVHVIPLPPALAGGLGVLTGLACFGFLRRRAHRREE